MVCTEIYQDVSKISGHHSRYRDNYKSQVYHVGCQVIVWQEGDIWQVTSDIMVYVSTSSESMSNNIGK